MRADWPVKLAGLAVFAGSLQLFAADPFQLTATMFPQPGANPAILQVSTSGVAPSSGEETAYRDRANWKVYWSAGTVEAPTALCEEPASRACIDRIDIDMRTRHLLVRLAGGKLPQGDGRDKVWTLLFQPPAGMAAVPAVFKYAPRSLPQPVEHSAGFFSPLSGTDLPDFRVSGTFFAGGNTKPVYTFQEQAGIYAPGRWGFLGQPGFTSSIAINQGAQPPGNRTRLDPDSLSAGLSFWRLDPVPGGGLVYGLITRFNAVGAEFSRSDPSSNIMSGLLTKAVLRRWKISPSTFVALYPVLGFEWGKNLKKPDQLMGTPVDLSRYSWISRGIVGSDAVFGIASGDRTANVFAINGSYRLRIPATDEPFIQSLHGQTSVDLTAQVRNWVEVDATYSPWQFKYLALNVKYQYGSLPPVFSFVDHQVSIGLAFQGKQSKKPNAANLTP